MMLDRSFISLSASRAFQFKNIQRSGHDRKSLAQAFLATRFRGRPFLPALSLPNGAVLFFFSWEQTMSPATKLPTHHPRRLPHPGISNGTGRFFLPHSPLRMREISLRFPLTRPVFHLQL